MKAFESPTPTTDLAAQYATTGTIIFCDADIVSAGNTACPSYFGTPPTERAPLGDLRHRLIITLDNYDSGTNSPAGAQKIIEFDVNIVECMVVIEYDNQNVGTYAQVDATNVDQDNINWF